MRCKKLEAILIVFLAVCVCTVPLAFNGFSKGASKVSSSSLFVALAKRGE